MDPIITKELIGAGGGLIGTGLGLILEKHNDKRQLKQQQKLQDQQITGQKQMADYNKQIALDMWEATNAKAQAEQYRKAGLNVGLMYEGGGSGATTQSAAGNVTGGTAAPQSGEVGMGMQLALQQALAQSTIELNKSAANKNNAEAINVASNTTTTEATRSILVENMKQSGIAQWFENLRTQYENQNPEDRNTDEITVVKNAIYNQQGGIGENSLQAQKLNADLFKTVAEQKNLDANALLTNKKAEGYWQELINATVHADADKIKAAATKLSAEWTTGEFTNWKTWTELGINAVQTLGGLIKNTKSVPIPKINK